MLERKKLKSRSHGVFKWDIEELTFLKKNYIYQVQPVFFSKILYSDIKVTLHIIDIWSYTLDDLRPQNLILMSELGRFLWIFLVE